uniref:ORF141 n=1 Tax=Euplotes crassus TaxID=5936 RepID=D1LDT7_EUPCR|nr:ORF141 [Moneuplotes crassus]
MFYLSLSYFWKHCTLLADPLMKKLIVRWINLNALTAANLCSVAHSKIPAFSFLSTRRYSFNSFVFFFASGLSQLPNFRQLQMFRLRYRTFALTHRRFNLILLPLLGHNSLPMTMHLSTTRLSITKLPNKLNFRRPSKVFFF